MHAYITSLCLLPLALLESKAPATTLCLQWNVTITLHMHCNFLDLGAAVCCCATLLVISQMILQVADGLEIGKEDSDEEKVAAMSAVLNIGETVYVKVVEIKEDDGSGRCKQTHTLS